MYSGPRYKDIETELQVARKRKSRNEILAAQYHENQRLMMLTQRLTSTRRWDEMQYRQLPEIL